MEQWFSYALGLSEVFSELKYEIYGTAVQQLAAATVLATVSQRAEPSDQTSYLEEQKMTGKLDEVSGKSGSRSGAAHADPQPTEKLKNKNQDAHSLSNNMFQAFLLTKPRSGGPRRKPREACLDEVEWAKELVYGPGSTITEDGFVLTKEDEAVLKHEITRQEEWFLPVDKDLSSQDVGTASPKDPEGQDKDGDARRSSEDSATEARETKKGGGMGLYGELTSKGVRQMYRLHCQTLKQFYRGSTMEHDATLMEEGDTVPACVSRSFPALLNVDVGSGTGKVLYEWALLSPLDVWEPSQNHPKRLLRRSTGTTFAETTVESNANALTCSVVTMGVEIIPSRMAVAREAIRAHNAALVTRSIPSSSSLSSSREAVKPPAAPLLLAQCDPQLIRPLECVELREADSFITSRRRSRGSLRLVAMSTTRKEEEEASSLSGAPSPSSVPSPLTIGDLLQDGSLLSSSHSCSEKVDIPARVVLTELNALLPDLLCNATLLTPSASLDDCRHPPSHHKDGASPAPHLALLCCGVGFDENFVRRLCQRLEEMLFGSRESAVESGAAPCGSGSSLYWRSASLVLLLRHFDEETVLRQMPLFRKVQRWQRPLKVPCSRAGNGTPAPGGLSSLLNSDGVAEEIATAPGGAAPVETPKENNRMEAPSLWSTVDTQVYYTAPPPPEYTRSSQSMQMDAASVAMNVTPRLRFSQLTYTHIETTWMNETPTWHLEFFFH